MSNFDRAVKALDGVDEAIDHLAGNSAYVTALTAEGLLAPDLPESEGERVTGLAYWREGIVHCQAGSGCVRLWVEDPRMGSEEARELAYALLAAAAYSEAE